MTAPTSVRRCDDCGHIEGLHLGGYCSGRPTPDGDPLDVAMCGCPEFVAEEYDEDFDDYRLCAGCSDLVTYLSSDDLCDGCVAEQYERPVLVPVVTVQPLARFL